MVRSIGIDPGDHMVKVVELDGSYRKTKLLRVHTAPVPMVGSDPVVRAEAIATAVEAAMAEGMRGEVWLGHPCREAVLRTIELPFKGHEAIRKVVKAEIEGEIHSHIVDDMIVDFHEIGPGAEGGTRVLVASVPKNGLRMQLTALAASRIEAEVVDLDTMALWRAAHWAGVFAADEDAPESPAGSVLPVTAIVDLGARSVKVLLVEGERLTDMRALRLGDAAVGEEIARHHGIPAEVARQAVRTSLATRQDQVVEVEEALPAPTADKLAADKLLEGKLVEGGPTEAVALAPKLRKVTVPFAEVEAAQTAFLQRIARELQRYLTACGRSSRITALWITGGASTGTGVKEMLAGVFGREPQPLDLLSHLQHELEPEVAAELGPRLSVAIGLALGKLGGPDGFQLRQEDLVLTRGFERVKFPLAITCLVGWLALFVYGQKRQVELRNLELQIGTTYINREKPKDPLLFHGMVNSVFRGKWFEDKQQFSFEKTKGKDYTYKDLVAEIAAEPVPKRLQIIRDRLRSVAEQKQKESGVYEDVSLESGLAVLVRWSELLASVHDNLGRYLIAKVDVNMKAPNRRLEFSIAFRGDDFRDKFSTLQQAIDAEYANPESPFERPPAGKDQSPEERFRDSDESGVRGAYYKITLPVKDVFGPFGPSRLAGGPR